MWSSNKQSFENVDAGEDRKWIWADAKIEGEAVLVPSPKVKAPIAARYAWGNGQQEGNLFNKAGLPAAPFRTDDWSPEEMKLEPTHDGLSDRVGLHIGAS